MEGRTMTDFERAVAKAERRRERYIKNRDEMHARQSAYREANREKIREYNRRYYAENREAINARQRWRYKHDAEYREHEDERRRAYRSTDEYRAWHAEYERKRYHRKRAEAASKVEEGGAELNPELVEACTPGCEEAAR